MHVGRTKLYIVSGNAKEEAQITFSVKQMHMFGNENVTEEHGNLLVHITLLHCSKEI